jgi:hypothetical protein
VRGTAHGKPPGKFPMAGAWAGKLETSTAGEPLRETKRRKRKHQPVADSVHTMVSALAAL